MSAPFEPTNTMSQMAAQTAALGLRVANMRKAYADEVAHQLRGWVGKDADRQTAAAALDTWVRRHALDDDLRGMVLTNFDPRRELVDGSDWLKPVVADERVHEIYVALVNFCGNVPEAIEWAADQPDVAKVVGPRANGRADIELTNGVVIEYLPTLHAWSVTDSGSDACPGCGGLEGTHTVRACESAVASVGVDQAEVA